MKSVLIAVVSAVQAYLLGSIDTGILVSKFLYHDDVRKYGSGAAGMTNMLRTFGKKAAALTAFGDVLKGVLAVCIGRWLFTLMPESTTISPYLAVYLAAIFAIIGHLKPLYFGFKGGKGVLVAGGTILAIQPVLIPFLAVIFLACLLPTGMVSLGSVTMAALYPVLTILPGLLCRRPYCVRHRLGDHGRNGHLHAPLQHPAHPRGQGVPLWPSRQKVTENSRPPRSSRSPATAGWFLYLLIPLSRSLPQALLRNAADGTSRRGCRSGQG